MASCYNLVCFLCVKTTAEREQEERGLSLTVVEKPVIT